MSFPCSHGTRNFKYVWLVFSEGFAGAFRIRQQERGRAVNVLSDRTSCFPERDEVAGTPDCGTRFLARFKDIPVGVKLFVSEYNMPGKGNKPRAGAARLVAADDYGVTSDLYPVPKGLRALIEGMPLGAVTARIGTLASGRLLHAVTALVQLPVQNGAAWAVWELMEVGRMFAATPEEVCFGVAVAAEPDAAQPGTCFVNRAIAPLTTVHSASLRAPVPRFIDKGVDEPAFTVEP